MTRTITLEVQVSDWATHVATDADGWTFEYEHPPSAKTHHNAWVAPLGRCSVLTSGSVDVADWTKTLRRITEDGRLVEV